MSLFAKKECKMQKCCGLDFFHELYLLTDYVPGHVARGFYIIKFLWTQIDKAAGSVSEMLEVQFGLI